LRASEKSLADFIRFIQEIKLRHWIEHLPLDATFGLRTLRVDPFDP
jgi:hypothetical protein